MQTATDLDLQTLRSEISGRVIGPSDPGYDDARAVMYGGIDKHPAVIVKVAGAQDIQLVVDLARDTGLELAIMSGGHSVAGHSATEGGILLDLRDMKRFQLDAATRTAWADAGLSAAEVSAQAAEHGLAIGFGDTGSVGVGGITTGGGQGYLSRKYGLTIDQLLAAEIVTADGQVLHVDADSHPDLFWGIRGGGGNFGVVSRFRFRLHDLPEFYGGMLILPATAQVIEGFVAAAEAAPDELSTIANVFPAPPMPFLPPDVVGQLVVMGMIAYVGGADPGAAAVAPFRALATPLADMVHPGSYTEMYPPEDPSYHPLAVAHTMFMDRVDRPVAETIMRFLDASDASMRAAQLRVLGGAIARVPDDATAYAHRQSRIMVNVASFYESDEDKPRREAWVRDFAAALQQSDRGAYVNFLGDEDASRVRAAYPGATWDRLVAVKDRYDPTNLFHLNQNIPPSAGNLSGAGTPRATVHA